MSQTRILSSAVERFVYIEDVASPNLAGSTMAFVYILQSQTNFRYYIGSTNNLERRLKEHNAGKSTYTKLTKPFKLVFAKEYLALREARQIEYKLKKLKSRKIIERIILDKEIRVR